MRKNKAITDCEIKISDECFELAELCKTFNAVELKKFKGIERYREMCKIAERIETIDECIWNQYEQLPPESKSKKEKLVLHARDEARQIKLRMESEEDPRKKYVSLHGSQEFNVSLPAESSTRKMIRKSKSISTTNLNRFSANDAGGFTSNKCNVSRSSEQSIRKSTSSPNLVRRSTTELDNSSNSNSVEPSTPTDNELSSYFEADGDLSNGSIFSTPNMPERSDTVLDHMQHGDQVTLAGINLPITEMDSTNDSQYEGGSMESTLELDQQASDDDTQLLTTGDIASSCFDGERELSVESGPYSSDSDGEQIVNGERELSVETGPYSSDSDGEQIVSNGNSESITDPKLDEVIRSYLGILYEHDTSQVDDVPDGDNSELRKSNNDSEDQVDQENESNFQNSTQKELVSNESMVSEIEFMEASDEIMSTSTSSLPSSPKLAPEVDELSRPVSPSTILLEGELNDHQIMSADKVLKSSSSEPSSPKLQEKLEEELQSPPVFLQASVEFLRGSGTSIAGKKSANVEFTQNKLGFLSHSALDLIHLIGRRRSSIPQIY